MCVEVELPVKHPNDAGFGWVDAVGQAELVRNGDVSTLELVDAAIDRIERLNPSLNAVIHERFEQARGDARVGGRTGRFSGVPLLLKDFGCRSAGDPYHEGSRFLKRIGYRADHDSVLTEKFKEAGFIILGRTNTPEVAMSITTEPVAYGATRNPWSLSHSPGGSSGGSAAAVAAGLVAAAHANDGGGSIRIPASNCGVVGLKPTRGRVSQGPDDSDAWAGTLVDHVITRSVRDSAGILDCIGGYEPGDPYVAPGFRRPLASEVGVDPGRLRIGMVDQLTNSGVRVDPECVKAVQLVVLALARLGHHVEASYPSALEDEAFGSHFGNIIKVCTARSLEKFTELTGQLMGKQDVEPETLALAALGREIDATRYVASLDWLHSYQRRMASWWGPEEFDLLVTPVIAARPAKLGSLVEPGVGPARQLELLQYTRQFNATGQPAISLPMHWTAEGLPVGVQLVAAFGREDVLIQVAAQLEVAQPWSDRHPVLRA